MANTLNDNIQGRHVVLNAEGMQPQYSSIEHRVFLAEGGYGVYNFTMGTALFGSTPVDGEEFRVGGYDVERYATAEEIRAAGGTPTEQDIAAGVV